MAIEAKIIADSINVSNKCRLTTFICTYPRYIHSEIMTHRMLSKNSASSRAIPVKKLIEQVQNEPVIPSIFPKNEAGMQASEHFAMDGKEWEPIAQEWLQARDWALKSAHQLSAMGLHKQVANRVIEPWMWIAVIISGTEWKNFFALRAHKDAHPDFQMLAYKMLKAYLYESNPDLVEPGGWHMPFKENMLSEMSGEQMRKIATARCARLSYLTFDGKFLPEKDYELHDGLAERGHWSPFEHCAEAKHHATFSGNFKGWKQYRKFFKTENRTADLESVFEDIQSLLINQNRI